MAHREKLRGTIFQEALLFLLINRVIHRNTAVCTVYPSYLALWPVTAWPAIQAAITDGGSTVHASAYTSAVL
jgi:hypothetical protein